MANFAQILGQLDNELQYSADTSTYETDKREVVRRVNRALCKMKEWPWLIREQTMLLFPDFDLANADVALLPDTTRLLAVLRTKFSGVMYPALDDGQEVDLLEYLAGAEFGLADTDLRDQGAANWEDGPFHIDAILLSPLVVSLWLDPRARLTGAITADEGDFRVAFPRWQLPSDCDTLVSLVDADGAELTAITDGEYRAHAANTGQTSTRPRLYAPDRGLDPRMPVKHGAAAWSTANRPITDPRQLRNANVQGRIVATASAGVGYTADQLYRVFVSWSYGGRFGPASNIAEVTPTGTDLQITLTGLPQLAPSAIPADADYGWRLAVFVAEGDGAFFLEANIDAPTPTDPNLILTGPANPTLPWKQLRWDQAYPGVYQYVKVWPRPSEMIRLTAKYNARPQELIEDSDEPWFDPAFHDYLVFAAAAQMSSRYSSDPFHVRCVREAARIFAMMEARYFPDRRHRVQKGQTGNRGERMMPPIRGVTYNGDS